jgi:hypothetical protein
MWCRDHARVRQVLYCEAEEPVYGEVGLWPASRRSTVKTASYTTTLSLIPSFGACTRSCFVPRYRSAV